VGERANLPAPVNIDRELIKEIAMDIGKEVVSHIRIMHDPAFKALGPSGRLSVRNCIHNQIMAALETIDADEIRARLERRKAHRRKMHKAWDNIRAMPAAPSPSSEGRG
jgi:hypothetical protein